LARSTSTHGLTHVARSAALALLATLAAGCSVEVEGWPVSCGLLDPAICRPVAEVAIGNLGWRHPAQPEGTITVEARDCPPIGGWPDWADPSQCWQAVIPLVSGEVRACMVFARRPQLGGYGQVAGDTFALPPSNETRGCPR
jgi:hypothetical protein